MIKSLKRLKGSMTFLFLKVLVYIPIQFLRLFILKLMGMKIGEKTIVYMGGEIRSPANIIIGTRTSIGHNCVLDGRGTLEIGDNVNLSSEVMIWTMEHSVNDEHFTAYTGKVTIKNYAWVSCRAILLPGITIGEGAVVAAGAVVTKSVDPYTIVGGIPAKKIGERNKKLNYHLGKSGLWFV